MPVIMTKDLAEKMAQDYREAIKVARYCTHENYRVYLYRRDLINGICYLGKVKYGVFLQNCDWVSAQLNGQIFACEVPWQVNGVRKMRKALQFRLNLLEKFIADANAQH